MGNLQTAASSCKRVLGFAHLTIESFGHGILDDASSHGFGGRVEALDRSFERVGGARLHGVAHGIEGGDDFGFFRVVCEALLQRALHGRDQFFGLEPGFGEDAHRHVLEGMFD